MTAGAKTRGVRGVVVDGRVRDLAEQREDGFPVSIQTPMHSASADRAHTTPSTPVLPLSTFPRSLPARLRSSAPALLLVLPRSLPPSRFNVATATRP